MQLDAIVLGGGPAGSNFSYQTAKRGFSVVLIERRSLGRYKCCGGAIPRELLELYQIPASVIERNIKGFLMVSPERQQVIIDSDKVLGATTYRIELDRWLVGRAEDVGVKVLFGRNAKSIKFFRDCVEVRLSDGQTYRSKVLIGASGTDSILYEQLNIQRPDIAIGMQMEFSMEKSRIEDQIGDRLEFYFDPSYAKNGYLWIFPKREGVSVGLVDRLGSGMKRLDLEAFVNNHPLASKKLKNVIHHLFDGKYFHVATIPNGPLERTFGERYLLLGDTAGLVDPITWQGIYYAMRSGDLASETFNDAFDKSDFSQKSLSSYQSKWKRLFGEIFLNGKKIQGLLYGKKMSKISSLVISELAKDDKLRKLIGNQLTKGISIIELIKRIPLHKKLGFLYRYS